MPEKGLHLTYTQVKRGQDLTRSESVVLPPYLLEKRIATLPVVLAVAHTGTKSELIHIPV